MARNHLPADIVLFNGKLITVDGRFRICQAVGIKNDRIVAVGSNEELRRYIGDGTRTVDLEGSPVVPGIVDSHTHPVGVGKNLRAKVQVADVRSLSDIFERLQKAQDVAKSGEWIVTATNWFYGQLERRPTLAELDAVTPLNPLWLPLGVHEGFTNSVGMRVAGITKETPDPPGGTVYKDPLMGEPTGHLRAPSAMNLVTHRLPVEDAVANLREGVKYLNSIGVTAVANDGVGWEAVALDEMKAYHEVRKSSDLTLRSVLMLLIYPAMSKEEIFGMIRAIAYSGMEGGGLGDDVLKVVGLKTVNENTATGEVIWPRKYLREVLTEAAKNKVRVTIHSYCGGDEETLSLYQEVHERFPIDHLRWAVIHQHFQTTEQIKLNKKLGLTINHELAFGFIAVGPEVWYGQLFGAPNYPGRLIAPVPLYLEAGIPFSLNSDAGCANNQSSIWASVYVACNRKKWPGWGEKYSISREDALRAVTMGGAYKLGMEDRIGSVEVGKYADLAVLSADPLTCDIEELPHIRAVMTVFDGRVVHEKA
jgi:predicted amidohydrolase YtcJ